MSNAANTAAVTYSSDLVIREVIVGDDLFAVIQRPEGAYLFQETSCVSKLRRSGHKLTIARKEIRGYYTEAESAINSPERWLANLPKSKW